MTRQRPEPFGAPFSLRRLFWAALLVLLMVLVYRCSAENAAQLQQYAHPQHHHAKVVPQ